MNVRLILCLIVYIQKKLFLGKLYKIGKKCHTNKY